MKEINCILSVLLSPNMNIKNMADLNMHLI